MEEKIKSAIIMVGKIVLNRASLSWDELEELYSSEEYPDLNREIDYILNG